MVYCHRHMGDLRYTTKPLKEKIMYICASKKRVHNMCKSTIGIIYVIWLILDLNLKVPNLNIYGWNIQWVSNKIKKLCALKTYHRMENHLIALY